MFYPMMEMFMLYFLCVFVCVCVCVCVCLCVCARARVHALAGKTCFLALILTKDTILFVLI